VKSTCTKQVSPAVSVLPVQKLEDAVNSVAFVPVIVAAPIGPVGEPPALVTMSPDDVFVVPTATEPKLKLVGAIDSAAVDGVPVPETATIASPPGLALTWSCAVAAPVTVGVNSMVTVHTAPPEST
jgi:hypothetical protein